MPIFPFHTWQPDAYELVAYCRYHDTKWVMVKMGVYAVLRWLIPVFPRGSITANVVIWLSVIGMVYASCIAWMQDDSKRLVAYSSLWCILD